MKTQTWMLGWTCFLIVALSGCFEESTDLTIQGDNDLAEQEIGNEEEQTAPEQIACTHLCDCDQGWFCNSDGFCEDGTGLVGTPFCCENEGCTEGAPCLFRDDTASRCGETQPDACTHLCDCDQGWFCNNDGFCEDGTGMVRTPFCCENDGCTEGAPCVFRDNTADRCEAQPDTCTHLCDCEQGWFCNDDGICEYDSERDGVPFCCENEDCPDSAICQYRNGDMSICNEPQPIPCTHLCDCEQGWFCNDDGACEDGAGLEGTPFCCDNDGCPDGAPCTYRNGNYGVCEDDPSCDCDEFYGTFCPDAQNTCESVVKIEVAASGNCSYDLIFHLLNGQTFTAMKQGCGDTTLALNDIGCGGSYDGDTNTFDIACNWCGVTTFSKANCSATQCTTDADCDGCSLCQSINGVGTCIGIGDYGCMTNEDCPTDSICVPFKEDMAECGGDCFEQVGYDLHEWGVNISNGSGSSWMSAGPELYWGAIPAKPVVYIYADAPMTLNVGVEFATGTTTETWPELPNSQSIAWNGVQVSNGACTTTPTPTPNYNEFEPEDREIYQLPEWVVDDASCLTYNDTVSKLLFYTGRFAEYNPPLDGTATLLETENGPMMHIQVRNNYVTSVGPTIFLYRDTKSECIDPSGCDIVGADLAWVVIPTLHWGFEFNNIVPVHRFGENDFAIPEGWEALATTLRNQLLYIGLNEAEADVFMDTWHDTFFGVFAESVHYWLPEYSNGAFLIYPWPNFFTGNMLELSLDPAPRSTKRAIIEYQKIDSVQSYSGALQGTVTLEEYEMDPTTPIYTGPAAGAIVAAWQNGELQAETTSDSEGNYLLELDAGTYTITADRNEWEVGDRHTDIEIQVGQVTTLDLTLTSEAMVDKPNLYLYPTETTNVTVTLDLNYGCEVTQSIPEYCDGWTVEVTPEGLINGQYRYLFYEAEIPHRFPMVEGWSVASESLENFFNSTLASYGLTDAETYDFVDYWTTHLPPAPYYAIYPLTSAESIDPLVGLDISPTPETMFRLWFVISPENAPLSLPQPEILPVVREGFTAVEWGVIVD